MITGNLPNNRENRGLLPGFAGALIKFSVVISLLLVLLTGCRRGEEEEPIRFERAIVTYGQAQPGLSGLVLAEIPDSLLLLGRSNSQRWPAGPQFNGNIQYQPYDQYVEGWNITKPAPGPFPCSLKQNYWSYDPNVCLQIRDYAGSMLDTLNLTQQLTLEKNNIWKIDGRDVQMHNICFAPLQPGKKVTAIWPFTTSAGRRAAVLLSMNAGGGTMGQGTARIIELGQNPAGSTYDPIMSRLWAAGPAFYLAKEDGLLRVSLAGEFSQPTGLRPDQDLTSIAVCGSGDTLLALSYAYAEVLISTNAGQSFLRHKAAGIPNNAVSFQVGGVHLIVAQGQSLYRFHNRDPLHPRLLPLPGVDKGEAIVALHRHQGNVFLVTRAAVYYISYANFLRLVRAAN